MEFLGVPIFDDDLYKLLVRLTFNLVFVFIVVRFAYFRHQAKREFVFTFMLMNVLIFFICFTLKKLDLGLGMALGLFAIFTIVRFRTNSIRVKEMTYLFLIIGLAVINALSNKKTSYAELLFTNVVIVGLAFVMESWFVNTNKNKVKATPLGSREFVLDNLELLKPERCDELSNELTTKTGLDVQDVIIKKVDLNNESAVVLVKYRKQAKES